MVGAIAMVAQWAGWSRLSSGVGDLATGGLVLVFLLGLAAGVSTCMAVTGGLVLAASAAHTARLDRTGPRRDAAAIERLRPVIMVNVGRVVGFTLLGAALGLVGARVSIPTQVLAVMMLAVALVMAVLGTRLTELSPRIAGWTVSLPSSWAARLGLDARAGTSYSDGRVALLGAATFFLPVRLHPGDADLRAVHRFRHLRRDHHGRLRTRDHSGPADPRRPPGAASGSGAARPRCAVSASSSWRSRR